jgi:hypothetical protein
VPGKLSCVTGSKTFTTWSPSPFREAKAGWSVSLWARYWPSKTRQRNPEQSSARIQLSVCLLMHAAKLNNKIPINNATTIELPFCNTRIHISGDALLA